MEWTNENKKVATTLINRLGVRVNSTTLATLLSRHLNTSVTAEDVDTFKAEFNLKPAPQAATKAIPATRRRRNVKESCRLLINELKEGIEEEKPATYAPCLTPKGLSPLLCLSDLHFGEVIEVNGQEIFNIDIARVRFESIIEQAIVAPELTAYSVDEIVVLLAGDIVDGELIYPAQAFETQGDVFSQLQVATKIIWKGLKRLAEEFPVVRVYCVPGNHGRSSKLHSQMSNWDNALYFGLQLMSSLDKTANIEVHTPHQMWMDFQVRNWNVHSRHIGVTQTSTAGPGRKVQTWLDQHDADLFFYGHYHTPEMYSIGYRRIFKNGALPPANDFAERLGFQDSPGQWLVGLTDLESVAFSKIIIPEN